MKKQIVITDLTRMYRGNVCIAGYDKDRIAVRPVLPPPGISESSLFYDDKPIIFPFAVVEFDFTQANPQPPHTEDYRYDPNSIRFIRIVLNRKTVLEWSLFESVGAIFEQPIQSGPGYYVLDCQGPRSLGTIQPIEITGFIYESGEEDTWDYRLRFKDRQGDFYKLKITDLAWQYYCHSLLSHDRDRIKITSELTTILRSSITYLRIGLARGWKKFPDRCYLQITGIYTFPDYLKGKTFADYLSHQT